GDDDKLIKECGLHKELRESPEARVAELEAALEKISQWQRDKCENASAEMLFMLLDNKVGIASAALVTTRALGALDKVLLRTPKADPADPLLPLIEEEIARAPSGNWPVITTDWIHWD
ncbi:MAG: hypothetical protein IIB99_08600, partial [Planctomycetes bacterium]|nr:hypothetical protein [Planctomycetota bacterium]